MQALVSTKSAYLFLLLLIALSLTACRAGKLKNKILMFHEAQISFMRLICFACQAHVKPVQGHFEVCMLIAMAFGCLKG